MNKLWQDLRYGFRGLMAKPGPTLVAVLTLALGIGANTAIFSVVNSVLLRPLPFRDSERLVRVGGVNLKTGNGPGTLSPPDFYDWRERTQSFESLAAYDGWSPSLTGAGDPERLTAGRVSADFFNVLGVDAQLGRAFVRQEEQRGNHRVVVLSDGLWRRRFNADREIVGRDVTLSGESYTVVGVTPADFELPQLTGVSFEPPELWTPFAPDLSQWGRSSRSVDAAIGRLKPGVSLEQAQAELAAVAQELRQQYPDENTNAGAGLVSLHEQLVGEVRTSLLAFVAAVGFVLLIACANVANLLLARAAARRKEMAIRTALGASRWRIVRQLLTESLLLSACGAAVGFLLALWAKDLLVALGSDALPHLGRTALDARVLLFTLGVTILTGLVFGLAPALSASRPDLNEALKEGGGKGVTGGARGRLRGLLVVSEVALSLVLLISAGLLVKSFMRLREVDPGFDSRGVLTMNVFLPGARYGEDAQQAAFFDRAVEELRARAGVEAVGVTSNLPISGNYDRVGFYVEDRPAASREDVPDLERYIVNDDYFRAMSIPLREGRGFGAQDGADAPPVALVNEAAAKKFWPGESAVGRRVRTDPESPWRTVVGVVGDVRHYGLETAANMQFYVPYRQVPTQVMTFALRAKDNPAALASSAREAVWAVDKDQPVYNVATMEELVAKSVAQRRFTLLLLGLFACVAVFLASVGIYGVMSYTVAQRTHEIGVRMALGAQPRDVLRLVVGKGLALALAGVGVGLVGALLLTRAIASLLYGVSATDVTVFAGVPVLLALVALAATYVPARRATKVDPMVALRYE
ncbi:MAG TPA: ABC transporter permease [Pyrinomonadaceae bacterium]|nr:ABC transporter permease [Pyrinomonadaceae bacterium]